MALTPCNPCDCIGGNISDAKFKQDVIILLCSILAASGGVVLTAPEQPLLKTEEVKKVEEVKKPGK